MIAASSSTQEQARLSGTNHSASFVRTSARSSGNGSTRIRIAATTFPGAPAIQSGGKTSASAGSKGRAPTPRPKAE